MPSLYLHIPFCEAKCIYCDFNSYAHQEHLYTPFVDALCADIARGPEPDVLRRLAPAPDGGADPLEVGDRAGPLPVATIFFGGGTPSVLTPEQIGQILDTCRAHYAVAPDAEISDGGQPRHDQRGQVRGLPGGGGQPAEHGCAKLRRRDAEKR